MPGISAFPELNVRTYVTLGGKPGVWFLSLDAANRLAVWAGSVEHWLTERYCLYAKAPDGSLWRNDVHHQPWPLQSAAASIERNTLLESHGIVVREPPTLLHFARRLDVVVWNAERAA